MHYTPKVEQRKQVTGDIRVTFAAKDAQVTEEELARFVDRYQAIASKLSVVGSELPSGDRDDGSGLQAWLVVGPGCRPASRPQLSQPRTAISIGMDNGKSLQKTMLENFRVRYAGGVKLKQNCGFGQKHLD